jgi:hypothetical protein
LGRQNTHCCQHSYIQLVRKSLFYPPIFDLTKLTLLFALKNGCRWAWAFFYSSLLLKERESSDQVFYLKVKLNSGFLSI